MNAHDMHAEFISVHSKTIEQLLEKARSGIIAAGTTSLRTIESLYWLGVKITANNNKLSANPFQQIPELGQWDMYEDLPQHITPEESLQSLLAWMENNKMETLIAKTKIIIAPGYKPRIAKGLITNFHQPQSTLLLLVAALIGDNWRKVYDYALQHHFRFLSYGDGSLLWFNEPEV